jgi:6-phosphogluconolactonase
MTMLLIGGYTGDKGTGKGITVLDGDEVAGVIPADSPSWIARHPELPVLYAVAEVDEGHVHAFSLAEETLGHEIGCGETGGAEPAHLTVDPSGRFLITANYSGGSISVHQLAEDGSIGDRTDLVEHTEHGDHPRQTSAHPHMVRQVGDLVTVIDLGGDAAYLYRLGDDGKLVQDSIIRTPAGSGPRHMLAVGGRYYLTAELSAQVLTYNADRTFAGAVPASMTDGPNQPSELASNGHFLYVANRGPNTVSVFALGEDLPRYVTEVPVGDWPRHIAIDGDRLYVANERSHQVMLLRTAPDTGIPALERTISVPSPTVVLP